MIHQRYHGSQLAARLYLWRLASATWFLINAAVLCSGEAKADDPGQLNQARVQKHFTIAILDFKNSSNDPQFQGLDTAVRSFLTTDLSSLNSLQIVERGRLKDLLQELRLSSGEFVDPRTAAKLGKGLAAQAVLVGEFFAQGHRMRIDARLVHVETGAVILAEGIAGKPTDFLDLEKQLARKVIDTFGIRLSRFEAAELERAPTRSLSAAASYGRAPGLR